MVSSVILQYLCLQLFDLERVISIQKVYMVKYAAILYAKLCGGDVNGLITSDTQGPVTSEFKPIFSDWLKQINGGLHEFLGSDIFIFKAAFLS